jgi:cobalt-zinc-cadmium efflux system membrane fusion protein
MILRPTTMRRLTTPPTLLLALLALPVWAQTAHPLGCIIEPEHVADLGSPVIGIIERLNVDRGDLVKKGQVLAILRSDVERAATEVARSRSQANAELQAAISNRNFAQQKFQRTQDLVARNFLSKHALDEASNELRIAEQKVSQAQQQLKVWERELGMAEAQLGLRSLKSPFDGVITERYLSLGERMEEKPIFRIAQIDPLRVEVIVPAAQFGSIKPGSTASVKPDLASVPVQQATVTLVDRIVDAASNTFRVRLRLPNPEHSVPAGLRCKIDFANKPQTTTSPPPVPPAAPPAAPQATTGIPRNVTASAGTASSRP